MICHAASDGAILAERRMKRAIIAVDVDRVEKRLRHVDALRPWPLGFILVTLLARAAPSSIDRGDSPGCGLRSRSPV